MTRGSLLNILENVMVDTGQERHQARAILAQSSTFELQNQFYRAVAAKTVNADGSLPSATEPTAPQDPPTPAPTVTKEDIEREKLKHQEELRELRLRGQAERIADHEIFKLRKREWEEPQRQAQLAKDRQTFIDASNMLRSFALIEANFNLIRSTLGEGFTVYAISQGLLSNALILVPPTQQQINAWAEQDEEARKQRLINASPSELKHAVRSESQARRAATAEDQAARELESAKSRCQYAGYKPLPPEIDSAAIKRAPTEILKKWIRLYGDFQLTSRIRGLA